MNIKLNTKTPIIYDFTRIISLKFNNIDIVKNNKELGLETSENVSDALSFLWDDLDYDVPGAALFFKNNENGLSYIASEYTECLHKFDDINELISAVFEHSIDKLQLSVLSFYDNGQNDDIFLNNLIENTPALYEYIESLNLLPARKWELASLINRPDTFLKPIILLCNRIKRKLKNIYKHNNEYLKTFNKEMTVILNHQPDHFFENNLKPLFRKNFLEDNKDIEITYSLINEFLFNSYLMDDVWYISIGTSYLKFIEQFSYTGNTETTDAFLKAFSDKQRMKILRLLINKEMYVGEIAKELGMILSTTSYHLDILLRAQIISARASGKKIYYSANRNHMIDIFKELIMKLEKSSF